jgi:hypothetical protein
MNTIGETEESLKKLRKALNADKEWCELTIFHCDVCRGLMKNSFEGHTEERSLECQKSSTLLHTDCPNITTNLRTLAQAL